MVTVIIATFNPGNVVANAIDSVLRQSHPDVECLVIDGKSTDEKTIATVQSYGKRINYVSEPDKGIYDAFNKGWKMAQGEWIMYLGADDELEPDAIKHLVKNAEDIDIIYGDTTFIFDKRIKKEKSLEPESIKKDMICSHQSLMMKKSVIAELNGFDMQYKIAADFDLIQRAYLQKYRFKHIPYYISKFNCNGISTNSCKNIIEAFHIYKNNGTLKGYELYSKTFFVLVKKQIKITIKKIINFSNH